jgi:hypothetical protein
MKHESEVLERRTEVLAFLKSRFPLYHQSNVFFRDIQYGIQVFLERKGIRSGYPESEQIARSFAALLEHEGVFVPIDRQSWALNYPEFRTPKTKPAPAAAAPKVVPPVSPSSTPKPAASAPAPAVSPSSPSSTPSSTPQAERVAPLSPQAPAPKPASEQKPA